jgi:hypothetical protein
MIYSRASYRRRYNKLSAQQQERVDTAISRFSQAIGKPHFHGGLAARAFGRYIEFRAGLDLRILALPEQDDWFLVCVGDHDELRAYCKGNA